MRYYKRLWEEDHDQQPTREWGHSTWYFEVDSEFFPVRQVILFENGNLLRYDQKHLHDRYGGLADQALDPLEFEPFGITSEEFELVWDASNKH